MQTTNKLNALGLTLGVLLTVYGFFGLTGLAVIGTVLAAVAVLGFLSWVNYLTGGALGAALFFWAL